jgi:hypothetical protein
MVHTCYEVMQLFKFLMPIKYTVSLFQEKVKKVNALNSAKKRSDESKKSSFLVFV